jgi:hypothetical protein
MNRSKACRPSLRQRGPRKSQTFWLAPALPGNPERRHGITTIFVFNLAELAALRGIIEDFARAQDRPQKLAFREGFSDGGLRKLTRQTGQPQPVANRGKETRLERRRGRRWKDHGANRDASKRPAIPHARAPRRRRRAACGFGDECERSRFCTSTTQPPRETAFDAHHAECRRLPGRQRASG